MDLKAEITRVEEKLKNDPDLLQEFRKEPVKAVEKVLGVDLPDEKMAGVVETIKAKFAAGEAKDAVAGAADKLKGLFGK